MTYHLYLLECADGTFYAGITTDLRRRLAEHNGEKTGAKYTRGRRPVKLVFSRRFRSRSAASKAEARFKKMSRKEKAALIGGAD